LSLAPTQAPATGARAKPAALRIAILGTRGIPASYGGFETFAEQLATRLVARGHEVTVYAETGESSVQDTFYQGVRVRHKRRPRWGAASVLAYDCACLWDACRGYDLVYMLGYGAAWACWWPRVFGVPVWINVDGLEWARSKWGRGARLYLRCMEWVTTRAATRLIADAEAIAQRFRQTYPGGAPSSFIAYGAELVESRQVDPAVLSLWGLQAHRYMLVVARPEPENHILEIIQGHVLHGGDWPLVIVGDVSGATAYQRQLKQHASERVRFIGGIYDGGQLASLRVHAACYLHGHSVGGTNPSLLEALACGNWVLAHDNPFNREVARDAADYFATPGQLARSLDLVVRESDALRPQRAQRARGIVAEHYTWDGITDAYEALMHSECRPRSAAAGTGAP
jgi:glycosyltransferase involved in cell wall biosynthesis